MYPVPDQHLAEFLPTIPKGLIVTIFLGEGDQNHRNKENMRRQGFSEGQRYGWVY